jgi:hypothetical protein
MRTLLKLAAAAAMTLSAPSAQAQNTYTFAKQQIGAWEVYGYRERCWMRQAGAVKTTAIAFALSKSNPYLYVGAEERGWTWIEHAKRYEVHVELGGVSGTMSGYGAQDKTLGPVLGIFVEHGDYFATLRSANRLKLTLDGTTLADMPMGGSGAAIDYFEKCAQALRVGPFNG